ncbi:MAG: pantothenate kinase [Candidatus Methanoplasma sp.]|jgi:pantoate kinase|nr:pantothenate kinase [Candidatus Methanoplasma sp.]
MISAFCPAHITCFFDPVRSHDILRSGSKGAGIRLRNGTTVHTDEIIGSTRVMINGVEDTAEVTRHVLSILAPGRNFEVDVHCDLPMGQGFGMSASGAVAAALCAAETAGESRAAAFSAAHSAEVICGGGLGDVAGLMHEGDVPLRVTEGLPPAGEIIDTGLEFRNMTLAVLGPKISTGEVLRDENRLKRISAAGSTAMHDFRNGMAKGLLFGVSNRFSSDAGLRVSAVSDAIRLLECNGISSAMCMLGNSIFIDAPVKEAKEILGNAETYSTASTGEPARIIRTG